MAKRLRQFSFQVGATPLQIATQNAVRAVLVIQNRGGAIAYLNFDGEPNPTSSFELAPLSTLVLNEPAPSNAIQARTSAGTAQLVVLEG